MIKYFKLFFLLIAFYLNSYGQRIHSPGVSDVLFQCETYNFDWAKTHTGVDYVELRWFLNGTYLDENGNTVVATNKLMTYRKLEKSGLTAIKTEYKLKINGTYNGALTLEVSEDDKGTDTRTWAIGAYVIPPPSPNGYVFCSPGHYTIEPIHTSNNLETQWFFDENSTVPFHRGKDLTKYFSEGVHTLYVEYNNNHGDKDCKRNSIRVPVIITVLIGDVSIAPTYAEIQPEPDYRTGVAECSRVGTYHDLDLIGGINESYDVGAVPVNITTSSHVKKQPWKPSGYYGNAQQSYRVCNRHLPAGKRTSRYYELYGDVTLNVDFFSPVNDVEYTYSGGCNDVPLRAVNVEKSRNCEPNWVDAQTIYGPINPSQDHSVEYISICPQQSTQIGPESVLFEDNPLFAYRYEWTPSIGLDDASSKLPNLDASKVQLPNGQYYKKYELKIIQHSIPLGTEQIVYRHTSIIYFCPDCPTPNNF